LHVDAETTTASAQAHLSSGEEPFGARFSHSRTAMSRAATAQCRFSAADGRFLRAVTRALITPAAYDAAHIDIVANMERLLDRANEANRTNVLRLVRWCRRIAFLYGGPQLPARGVQSRFIPIQKLARALSSLCLLAFWGDEAAIALLDAPERTA
jgi:hypothetical protein